MSPLSTVKFHQVRPLRSSLLIVPVISRATLKKKQKNKASFAVRVPFIWNGLLEEDCSVLLYLLYYHELSIDIYSSAVQSCFVEMDLAF